MQHDLDTEMIIVISSFASKWRHFEDPDPNPNLNDNRHFGVEIMLAGVGRIGGGGEVLSSPYLPKVCPET